MTLDSRTLSVSLARCMLKWERTRARVTPDRLSTRFVLVRGLREVICGEVATEVWLCAVMSALANLILPPLSVPLSVRAGRVRNAPC
jgi:hypothetical protein